MRRVTGIGGIFFYAKDPKAPCAWYKAHLGIDVQEWGGTAFTWTDAQGNPTKGTTIWSIGAATCEGNHFAPSKSSFMINYRVEDLASLLQALRDEGCEVLEKTDDSEYGKFGAGRLIARATRSSSWQPPPGRGSKPPVPRHFELQTLQILNHRSPLVVVEAKTKPAGYPASSVPRLACVG
ncbi:MAG: VOC family protein [Comamonadaceae bacterium]|nr:VOC family protein [Comamonadaceae bacterium]